MKSSVFTGGLGTFLENQRLPVPVNNDVIQVGLKRVKKLAHLPVSARTDKGGQQ